MNDTSTKSLICAALATLLTTLPAGTRFTSISDAALDLAENETLADIKAMTGAESVTVVCRTEDEGDGDFSLILDEFRLHYPDGSRLLLTQVDAWELLDDNDPEDGLAQLAPVLIPGFVASDEAYKSEELRSLVVKLYEHLNDLPRLKGLKFGERGYRPNAV